MKTTHNLNVQRLQSVSGGLNEVYASMDAVVNDVHSVNLVFGIKVRIKSLLNVIDNWAPRFVIVDKITETWSINNSQT